MRPLSHLTVRVAWHDSKWNGTVCADPSLNAFCSTLPRIREAKTAAEQKLKTRPFHELEPHELPPCKAESGFFMSPKSWAREFDHPYRENKKCVDTHGKLKKRILTVPAFSAVAVPFNWMLRRRQKHIDEQLPQPLPADESAPFPTPWVFGKKRQEALVDLVFGRLDDEKSLVFFYAKEGHPVGDRFKRLIVGIGRITKVGKREHYDNVDGNPGHPFWDRVIGHSIRPDASEGFLLPYHDYLQFTGDPTEDERRRRLLTEIVVTPTEADQRDFSYGSEITSSDVALSVLARAMAAVRRIREHGIVPGPWQEREAWLNQQIDLAWRDRGAFPGAGVVLEALGLGLGTALIYELRADGSLKPEADPWPVLNKIFRGERPAPHKAFDAHIATVSPTWLGLRPVERTLAELLSRFDLTTAQAKRVWHERFRRMGFSRATTNEEIISNPYLLAERDLGAGEDLPITPELIDHGLLPDAEIAADSPVPEPSRLHSPTDRRRVRCGIVTILRKAATEGDSLVSLEEVLGRLAAASPANPVMIPAQWIEGNIAFLDSVVDRVVIEVKGEPPRTVPALQLTELKQRETKLSEILRLRCARAISSPKADWKKLIANAIAANSQPIDPKNPRHMQALTEQASALERVVSRRLSVLVGGAGTGKTSVVGGLVTCAVLQKEGVLLLAPTGKARVRLQGVTGGLAMTVAQFLHRLKRYDGPRQRPLFEGTEKYREAKTVIVDEASMLTMDDLLAVLLALDMTLVQRIVLVGDPNQLPPIGVGRPFADLVSWLTAIGQSTAEDEVAAAAALARLTVEVRSVRATGKGGEEQPSDTLRLASWFTNTPPDGNAEHVLSRLSLGESLNDLEVAFWTTPEELRQKLITQFQKHLGLKGPGDAQGFNKAFGFADEGWIKRDNPDGIENWQLLSPVRMGAHGVMELNRWVQGEFRAKELRAARDFWATSIGDEGIVVNDKVIQLRNGERDCYFWTTREAGEDYLANGEIGTAAIGREGFLNVFFAGRPNVSFGYRSNDFGEDDVPLELAYALTIHKAQGSQFRTVFVVLPKASRLLSRELVYTALTRSRQRMVLLVEGQDTGILYTLSQPERSDTCRRNTNLFSGVIRERSGEPPHAENLIHKTDKGHMVRSKSELVIANLLCGEKIPYEYELPLDGETIPGRLHPDFSFSDAAGDRIIWEHLGMMDDDEYRRGWDWKREWYRRNGFVEGRNLFVTEERKGQGLAMDRFRAVAEDIRNRAV